MGLLVGLFVLMQTTVVPEAPSNNDQQEQSESDTDSSNEQTSISEAVPTSGSQIYLGYQSILLQVVTTAEDKEDNGTILEKVVPTTHKALKVLFRRIISPNAP